MYIRDAVSVKKAFHFLMNMITVTKYKIIWIVTYNTVNSLNLRLDTHFPALRWSLLNSSLLVNTERFGIKRRDEGVY